MLQDFDDSISRKKSPHLEPAIQEAKMWMRNVSESTEKKNRKRKRIQDMVRKEDPAVQASEHELQDASSGTGIDEMRPIPEVPVLCRPWNALQREKRYVHSLLKCYIYSTLVY